MNAVGSISLNVTHAPWIPERAKTLQALRQRLGVAIADDDSVALLPAYTPAGPYKEETTKAPAWMWQALQLQWTLQQRADWGFFTQDDAIVPDATPWFWSALRAMCEGSGYDVICLHNGHPAARTLFVNGATGYTTSDGVVGQFFGAKREILALYDAWRRFDVDEALTRKLIASNGILGEDTLFGMFCMYEGLRIFHPLPTLYDHDLSITSTNEGYDEHLYRAPQVCWYDTHHAAHAINVHDPAWWGSNVVHLGRFYNASHKMLPGVLRDKTRAAELVAKYDDDACPRAYSRFFQRAST